MSNLKTILITLLLLVCVTLIVNTIHDRIQFDQERKTYMLDNSKLQHKVSDIRDSAGREIQTYTVQTIDIQQLLNEKNRQVDDLTYQLHLSGLKLKNLHSSVSVNQSTHDTLHIPIHDTIACMDSGTLQIPFSDTTTDTFLRVTGTSQFRAIPHSLVYESTRLDYTLRSGVTVNWVDKSRFLQRSQLELQVAEHNPHSITYGVQSYSVRTNRKFFQKFWFHAAIGAAGALVIQHYLK